MQVEPVTLEGTWVRLEPLAERHVEDLAEVVGPEEIWTWMSARPTNVADVRTWLETTLKAQAAGTDLPFAIIDQEREKAIGSTRFLDIQPHHRGVEIGWTWLGRNYWRTPVNTECKYLLLRHAFETWNCIRVQLKTDRRNERSRRAIERIGGQFEGILRNHRVLADGTFRDSAYYSITDREWPEVKARLEAKMTPDPVTAPER